MGQGPLARFPTTLTCLDLKTTKLMIFLLKTYTVAAVQCSLPKGRQSRAELMHCLACAMLSEAQGSVESREA